MKFWLMIFVLATTQLFADIRIENVKAEPIGPWENKVYISYEVSGTLPADANQYVLCVNASNIVSGELISPKSVDGDMLLTLGAHKIVWDVSAERLDLEGQKMNFTVWYTQPPLYLVINLSDGPSAMSYPVTSLSAVPEDGWSEEYKTTRLVLRRIGTGIFMMGSPSDETSRRADEVLHKVIMTKVFYIGVFEVTQRQWELVLGTQPSYFKGQSLPVDRISYDMIRGASAGARWPNSSAVDADSFLGVLQKKTGIEFDLPTEAQWEYACRAGTTTALNNGKGVESIWEVGRCQGARYYINDWGFVYWDTDPVGSHAPNHWGLYDMHGNVWEWCKDWYETLLSDAKDPVGCRAGSNRVRRGGDCNSWDNYFRSAARSCCSSGVCGGLMQLQGAQGFRLSYTVRP